MSKKQSRTAEQLRARRRELYAQRSIEQYVRDQARKAKWYALLTDEQREDRRAQQRASQRERYWNRTPSQRLADTQRKTLYNAQKALEGARQRAEELYV